MERRLLETFYENKTKIKLCLKNGNFYTGYIIEITNDSILFRDKYNNELPFDLETIGYVDIVEDKNGYQ